MGFTSGGYIMQRGLGRAQFRKLETVASRLSHCDHFKPLFPAKWIISELLVIRRLGHWRGVYARARQAHQTLEPRGHPLGRSGPHTTKLRANEEASRGLGGDT